MKKLYKWFIVFYVSLLFHCGILLACFIPGKWYMCDATSGIPLPVLGPLLADKENVEKGVKFGCRYNKNILVDEETNVFYINEFFPHLDGAPYARISVRQMGDVFLGKSLLSGIELEKIKQVCRQNVEISEPDEYIVALKHFISLAVTYLRVFEQGDKAVILEGIIKENESLKGWELLDKLNATLRRKDVMKSVWDCMHTERLLIFDKYYDVDSKTLKIPTDPLVFVSHYDMCESCEKLMVETLEKMEGISSAKFCRPPHPEADYKILVGSFSPYRNSRSRHGESELLKVALSQSFPEGVKRPSFSTSTPEPVAQRHRPSSTSTSPTSQVIVVRPTPIPSSEAAAAATEEHSDPFGKL